MSFSIEEIYSGVSCLMNNYLPSVFPPDCLSFTNFSKNENSDFLNLKGTIKTNLEDRSFVADFLDLNRSSEGVFLFDNKEYFSPYIIVEKRNRFLNDSGKKNTKDSNTLPVMDLNEFFIIPGYYLYRALSIIRTFFMYFLSYDKDKKFYVIQKKDSPEEDFLKILESHLSDFSFGAAKMPLFLEKEGKDGKEFSQIRYIQVNSLLPLFEKNLLHRKSELSKVVYHGKKVADSLRWPHRSHLGKLDLLESPESVEMGLVLFLAGGGKYNPKTLSIEAPLLQEIKQNPSLSLSRATSLVPFLNYSDGPRVMMGGKNLKQAVKVEGAEIPVVKTGFEEENGLIFGANALTAYQLFNGYNFEDGIVVSESFAKKMLLKRNHIEKNYNKLWAPFSYEMNTELLTERENVGEFFIYLSNDKDKNKVRIQVSLRKKGVVKPGDWLVKGRIQKMQLIQEGKKGRSNKAIYSEKWENRGNLKFLLYYKGSYPGNIIKNTVFSNSAVSANLKPLGLNTEVMKGNFCSLQFEFDIEQSCPLATGDKITGRHGNKGTVSKILPDNEMPVVKIGDSERSVEVIISPMSVVSRLNLGQLMEVHYSLSSNKCNITPFKVIDTEILLEELKSLGADDLGYFDVSGKRAVAGYQYFVRLDHLVRDKLHCVDNAVTNFISGQPVKGKKNGGGQRIGEMEFWTLFNHNVPTVMQDFALCNSDKDEFLKNYLRTFNLLMFESDQKKLGSKNITKDDIKRRVKFDFSFEGNEINSASQIISEIKELSSETEDEFKRIRGFIREKARFSVIKLITGKDGYIRKHMLGRRINYSGRAVISPIPDIDIDHVFLPVDFALCWFSKTLKEGFKGDLKSRDEIAKWANTFIQLNEYMVILNRQPSLHRHSMQAFFPRFWSNYSIGLPIMVCEGFGADFDGDTMAVYLPYTFLSGTQEEKQLLKEEMKTMLPISNPFKSGNHDNMWSISQDMVYGAFSKGIKKDDLNNIFNEIIAKENEGFESEILKIQNKFLSDSVEKNISLSVFDSAVAEGKGRNMSAFVNSKARGKKDQFLQMYKKNEEDISPKFSTGFSFEEYMGLDEWELSIPLRARRSLLDKKLRVADAGYITRKLVEFLYPLRITETDCGCSEGLAMDRKFLEVLKSEGSLKEVEFYDFLRRFLLGRYVRTSEKSFSLIDDKGFEKIKDCNMYEVRSPIFCRCKEGVCARCYGVDLARPSISEKYLPQVGSFVGLSSGHSIGECSTQLSMKTFQSGQSIGKEMRNLSKLFKTETESDYKEYLTSLGREGVDLKTVNVFSIHLEILFSQLKRLKIFSESEMKSFLKDPLMSGLFTSLSFEGTRSIILKLLTENEKIETREYSPKAIYALKPEKIMEVFKDGSK